MAAPIKMEEMRMAKPIKYPSSESLEFVGLILDKFEDFLEARGITEKTFMNDDKRMAMADNYPVSILYGEDYSELQEYIENLMLNAGFFKEERV